MGKTKKSKKLDKGNIIPAIIFIAFLVGLIIYALIYDPNTQYDNSFFNDVARSIQWQ